MLLKLKLALALVLVSTIMFLRFSEAVNAFWMYCICT